jgi:hypothetical protein
MVSASILFAHVLESMPYACSLLLTRCFFSLSRRPPRAAVAQDLPDQEEAGEEAAPEPPHPLLDPHAHRQYHQVRGSHLCSPQSPSSAHGSHLWFLIGALIRASGTTRSAGTGAAPSLGSKRGKMCRASTLREACIVFEPGTDSLSRQAWMLLLRFCLC